MQQHDLSFDVVLLGSFELLHGAPTSSRSRFSHGKSVWLLGWVLLALVLIAATFLVWSVARLTRSVMSTQHAQEEQIKTLISSSEALIHAWEVQKRTQSALIDWAEFSTEKLSIIDYNDKNKPVSRKEALTKRTKP